MPDEAGKPAPDPEPPAVAQPAQQPAEEKPAAGPAPISSLPSAGDVLDDAEDTTGEIVDQAGEVISNPPAGPLPVPTPTTDSARLPDSGPAPLIPGGALPALMGSGPLPPPAAAHPADVELAECSGDDRTDHLDITAPTKRIKRDHPTFAHHPGVSRTPCSPGGDGAAVGCLAWVAALGQTGADQLAATLPAATVYPALSLLRELRPRGDIPATRSLHIEPRPA